MNVRDATQKLQDDLVKLVADYERDTSMFVNGLNILHDESTLNCVSARATIMVKPERSRIHLAKGG